MSLHQAYILLNNGVADFTIPFYGVSHFIKLYFHFFDQKINVLKPDILTYLIFVKYIFIIYCKCRLSAEKYC